MSFKTALALTLSFEGGYVNHPADPGGATNKGITQRTYDEWRTRHELPPLDVKDLAPQDLENIYRTNYWNRAKCDALAEPLATFHFDAAVNHGVGRATKFLAASKGEPKSYLTLREAFYRKLVEQRPTMAVFLKGWLRRVEQLRTLLPPR